MADIQQFIELFLKYFFWVLWIAIPISFIFFYVNRNRLTAKCHAIDTFLICIFSSFVFIYIATILHKEDFAYYDETSCIRTILTKTSFFATTSVNTDGRFAPLGFKEFELIKKFTQSPIGFHIFPILQLLVFLFGFFLFLKKFPTWFRIAIATIIITTPSFVISFFGLIFPERNVLFWLFLLLVCFQYFLKTRSTLSFAGALIATQFALYCKEPVFLLIGGFTGLRLFLQYFHDKSLLKLNDGKRFLKSYFLEICLLFLSGVFLLIYFSSGGMANLFGQNPASYSSIRAIGIFPVLARYLYYDLFLTIFLVTLICRFIYLIFAKQLPDFFWDSLAFGAFLYFLSYIKLEIFSTYYMAPVDLIAILYLSQFVYLLVKKKKPFLLSMVFLIFFVVFGRNLSYSFFEIVQRKNLISSKVRFSEFLKNYGENESFRHVNLFFPYSHRFLTRFPSYTVSELTVFLKFKGLRNSQDNIGQSTSQIAFTVKRPVKSAEYFYAAVAQPGDLIVVLPDDDVSSEELIKLKQETTLLFHYNHKLFPLAKRLISIFFIDNVVWDMPYEASGIYVFRKP